MSEQSLILNPRPQSYLSLLDERLIGKICGYLNFYSLLQFGELDINYQRIIGEQIFSKRTLNVGEIRNNYLVRDLFRYYGEYFTALRIHDCDIQYKKDEYTHIEEIFRLIKKRCIAEKLKTVEIYLTSQKTDAKVFLDVFAKLESLTIGAYYRLRPTEHLESLLEKLLKNCTNLHSLTLQNLAPFDIGFMALPSLQNLRTLTFKRCFISYNSWLQFVSCGSRPLESLILDRAEIISTSSKINQTEFLNQIVAAFPNLGTFVDFSNRVYFSTENVDCKPLANLQQLKELRIVDRFYSNLIPSVAGLQLLHKLSLRLTGITDTPIDIYSMTNLRSIEFFDPSKSQINVYTAFLTLPQLTECTFSSISTNYYPEDLDLILLSAVMASPRLRVLKVHLVRKNLPSALYVDLVKKRKRLFSNAPPLHLHAKFSPLFNTSPDIIKVCKLEEQPFYR